MAFKFTTGEPRIICGLWFCFFLSQTAALAGEYLLQVDYPSFKGDFYASGAVSFPPGAAPAENNIIVREADTGSEVPSKISVLASWPDQSILKATVIFPANSSRRQNYLLVFGEGIERREKFNEPAVLPSVSFSSAGAPKSAENMDVNVGQLNVRVDRSSGIYYYWHVVPIVLLLAWTWLRSRRNSKAA